MAKKTLKIQNLGIRHYGLTASLGAVYEEAASVRLSNYHTPPKEVSIVDGRNSISAHVEWVPAGHRTCAAYGDTRAATEQGAYGLALAALELTRGYVAIHRAEQGSRVDYYLAPIGSHFSDLEESIRLEVSGIDDDTEKKLRIRLKKKLEQASKGDANMPAIAAVVGFRNLCILCEDLK